MKKKIFIGIAIVVIAFIAFASYRFATTKNLSPAKVASYSENGLDIQVKYSSPSKRGRLIFGEKKDEALQPYGQYWRLGANDATEVTFNKNVTFAGKPINAGGYRMFAVPGPTSFLITLNSELGKFGYFEPDYTLDVIKVDVPVQATPLTESLTFSFSSDSTGVNMDIAWDTTLIRVPIKAQ